MDLSFKSTNLSKIALHCYSFNDRIKALLKLKQEQQMNPYRDYMVQEYKYVDSP